MPHKSVDGYISVTEVLDCLRKKYLEFWRGKHGNELCNRIQKESQEIGTQIHQEIQDWITGATDKTLEPSPIIANFDSQFWRPRKATLIWAEPEEPFTDTELKLQGTPDALIELDGKPCLADWKTSSQLDPISNPLQLAAYCHLSNINSGKSPQTWRGIIVRLDKKTHQIEVKEYSDLRPHWEIFRALTKIAFYCRQKGEL